MALKDEILAMIASKIEGQGTAVDAGSALPGILRGIIEYVDGIAAGIPAAQIQSDWSQADNTKVDFIKNKPTIPAAQIQSDWNQADNTKLDYIKNKPAIPAGALTVDGGDWTTSPYNITLSSSDKEAVKTALTAGRPVLIIRKSRGTLIGIGMVYCISDLNNASQTTCYIRYKSGDTEEVFPCPLY